MGEFKAPAAQQNKTATPVQAPKEASSLGETEYVDSRASTFQFIQLQAAADDKGKGNRITQLQSKSTQFTSFSRVVQLQAKRDSQISSTQSPVVQREENKTGLPDGLKSGMESISGLSLNDVKVHRNSDKPAQLQAHAYAQGTDIHLGPGQEKHLPHELGHVVQQKEGRVKPTVQLKDKVSINDDSGLEKEADVLGEKAKNLGMGNEATPKTGILQAKGFKAEIVQLTKEEDAKKKGLQAAWEHANRPNPPIGSQKQHQGAEGSVVQRPFLSEEGLDDEEMDASPTGSHEQPKASSKRRLTNEERQIIADEAAGITEIRDLEKEETIYDLKGTPLGKVKNFIRNYAATQVSKSSLIKNEKGEDAYTVNSKNKALITAGSSAIAAYDAGAEIAQQVKYTMEEGKVKNSANEAKNTLSKLGGAFTGEFSIEQFNMVSDYFKVLELLDVFGVTNILNSIGSFLYAKKEKSKISVLDNQLKSAKGSPAFSEDLAEVAEYALAKVARSYYESMAQGILEGIQAVTRIVTIASGATAALFTEPINLASKLVQTTISLYHMVKGIFKFFRGTRGVGRKNNAEKVFNLCASGNPQGLTFLQDYFAAGLPTLQKLAVEQLRSKKIPGMENYASKLAGEPIQGFFKMLKDNESTPEIKLLKSYVIDQIALQFKSKPPSGSAFIQVLLKQEAVQNGLGQAFEEATNS